MSIATPAAVYPRTPGRLERARKHVEQTITLETVKRGDHTELLIGDDPRYAGDPGATMLRLTVTPELAAFLLDQLGPLARRHRN